MNLRSLDLNLLVVLDALLDEAHVSRAADRLAMSQPAASAALQRCRYLFRDELLERGRGTMRLTPKAEALRAPLKSLLADVIGLVDPPRPPLSDIRQTLRITMADYPAIFMIGSLLSSLQATAPGIDVTVQPWHGAEAAKEALVSGASDLALSVFPPAEDDLYRQHLLDEHYIVAMRAEHPAATKFTLEEWLAWPHIFVSGRGENRGALDAVLAERGLSRRVGVVVPAFGLVPELLRGTNMVAMLPSHCVPSEAGLITFSPPISVPGFSLHLAWHKRRTGDVGLQHVVELLCKMLSDASEPFL